MDDLRPLLVGTAGHIDHGKSALVRALTGVDPDRLPEEQTRGMTIDLGFAHRKCVGADLYFVDVPGHERFLRNMVTGATGIDVALMVIAADDGVMPQSREHADVLQVLAVPQCVLVLTKIDLVDAEWAGIVADEGATMLAERGLAPVATVHTSATRGDGLDELLALLSRLAREPRSNALPYKWFRMPVDRAFTVPGRGTVVTGSVMHGSVAPEDELELWPTGRRVRVRALQTHNQTLQTAAGRLRLAINLPNVELAEVPRGVELATPGFLQPTQRFEAALTRFRPAGKAGKTGSRRVRLHIGTSEVLATVRISREIADSAAPLPAEIRTAKPVCVAWGQRFVLRDESGQKTLGGGEVTFGATSGMSPRDRVLAALARRPWRATPAEALSHLAGLADAAEARKLIESLIARDELIRLGGAASQAYMARADFEALAASLTQRVQAHLAANPRLPGIERASLVNWLPRACPEPLRPALAEQLLSRGVLSSQGAFLRPAGVRPRLSRTDSELYSKLLAAYAAAGLQPPMISQAPVGTARDRRRVEELAELAAAHGQLFKLAPGLFLHVSAWHDAAARVREFLASQGPQTLAAIRDVLHSSRKVVVPLAEALDAAGVTVHVGDLRALPGAGGPQTPLIGGETDGQSVPAGPKPAVDRPV